MWFCQEQSQVPTIPYYRENSMYPSARFLDSLISQNEAQTLFFLTWGRRHGGQQMINGYVSYPFVDFFQMQDTLNIAYLGIAQELNAAVAPVGMAWAQAVTLNPQAELWQEDNSHPTLQGSYLTACVFYATLFNSSPVGYSIQLVSILRLPFSFSMPQNWPRPTPKANPGVRSPYGNIRFSLILAIIQTTFSYLLTSAGRVDLHPL